MAKRALFVLITIKTCGVDTTVPRSILPLGVVQYTLDSQGIYGQTSSFAEQHGCVVGTSIIVELNIPGQGEQRQRDQGRKGLAAMNQEECH